MRAVTILGVRIRVHPSWLLIFLLLVASLLSWVEGPGPERLSFWPGLVVAGAVAALFLVSVLVHELAHALVARRRGVPVDEIRLLMFDGPAGSGKEPTSALSEALIAGAGPIASGLVGAVCLAAAWALPAHGPEGIRMAWWLAWCLGVGNLMLAGLNLIPGFPMDGGRILRAVAWGITGDLVRATRVASLVGRGCGYVAIFAGFLLALRGSIVVGLWLVLIGWFLGRAARGSYNHVRLEQLVDGLRVADAVLRDVAVVGPNLTLDTLVEQHRLHAATRVYPVTQDGDLVGAIDIRQVDRVPRRAWTTTRVTDVMRRGAQLVTFTEPQPLMDAVTSFEQSGADAFPVVDPENAQRLLGMVTREAVIRLMRSRAARRAGAPAR